jgi:electron transport complex protein RnfD
MSEATVKLPDPAKLIVSSSPHYRNPENVPRIMLLVILALMPACIAGVVFFGWGAVKVLAVCTVSCVAFEALFCRMLGRSVSIGDYSALLSGILLALNLSAATPWWICVIGALIAMGLGKHIYGGLGYNPFNPVLVARVGLLIGFTGPMTYWVPTRFQQATDAVSTATPLGMLQDATPIIGHDYLAYFLGNIGGCLGETSALALLLGGAILVYFKLIRWQVPVVYIGTVAVITGIVHMVSPATHATPLFHILTGGLMIGAIFMATDMVTSPMSVLGCIIFGLGCGILTSVIRIWGSYPEGVSFAILLMNALTPLIDRYTKRRPFGARSPKEVAA